MRFHYAKLEGYKMTLSREFSTLTERDLAMADAWASTNCQAQVDFWPAERLGPDHPMVLGDRFTEEHYHKLHPSWPSQSRKFST